MDIGWAIFRPGQHPVNGERKFVMSNPTWTQIRKPSLDVDTILVSNEKDSIFY